MARRTRKLTVQNERVSDRGYRLDEDAVERRDFSRTFRNVNPANSEVYDPLPKSLISEDGAWIMIRHKLPPIEHGVERIARVGRIFWAEQFEESDDEGFLSDGRYKIYCYLPEIKAVLWPYEYSTIGFETILDVWQKEEIIFHPMDMEAGRFNDVVFYCRTRGISKADAIVMALGTIKGPVGWFEPTPELAVLCEAMEERVNRFGWNREDKRGQ